MVMRICANMHYYRMFILFFQIPILVLAPENEQCFGTKHLTKWAGCWVYHFPIDANLLDHQYPVVIAYNGISTNPYLKKCYLIFQVQDSPANCLVDAFLDQVVHPPEIDGDTLRPLVVQFFLNNLDKYKVQTFGNNAYSYEYAL